MQGSLSSAFWAAGAERKVPFLALFLSVVGLGVCEEGRSAWKKREEKEDCVVLYWPNPQTVRKCMYLYKIRRYRNVTLVLYLLITNE